MFYYKEIALDVPEGVYCPREDSLLLAGVIEGMDLGSRKCLDMGCGSGLLGILMEKKGAEVTAADISTEAVGVARKNAEMNGAGISFVASDLFEKIAGVFDLIVFNPPYLPVDEYPHGSYTGGITGREIIERFLKEARAHLNTDGKILLVISSLTGEKGVIDFAQKQGYKIEIIERKKIDWEELIAVGGRTG